MKKILSRIKKSIKMMNSQRSDTEKNNLIEEGKIIGIDDVIKSNEIIKLLSLKYKTMSSYCLKSKKNTENINTRVSNTNNRRTMMLSKCSICDGKKSKFIKEQEKKGLLSNLGIITP